MDDQIFQSLTEILDRYFSSLNRGWDYASHWDSVIDAALWCSQFLPEDWGLSALLGPGAPFFDTLHMVFPYLGLADYAVDTRLLITVLSIMLTVKTFMFGIYIYRYVRGYRRGSGNWFTNN
jgi:hypothetical protein